jgi:hypothetical protein
MPGPSKLIIQKMSELSPLSKTKGTWMSSNPELMLQKHGNDNI